MLLPAGCAGWRPPVHLCFPPRAPPPPPLSGCGQGASEWLRSLPPPPLRAKRIQERSGHSHVLQGNVNGEILMHTGLVAPEYQLVAHIWVSEWVNDGHDTRLCKKSSHTPPMQRCRQALRCTQALRVRVLGFGQNPPKTLNLWAQALRKVLGGSIPCVLGGGCGAASASWVAGRGPSPAPHGCCGWTALAGTCPSPGPHGGGALAGGGTSACGGGSSMSGAPAVSSRGAAAPGSKAPAPAGPS